MNSVASSQTRLKKSKKSIAAEKINGIRDIMHNTSPDITVNTFKPVASDKSLKTRRDKPPSQDSGDANPKIN